MTRQKLFRSLARIGLFAFAVVHAIAGVVFVGSLLVLSAPVGSVAAQESPSQPADVPVCKGEDLREILHDDPEFTRRLREQAGSVKGGGSRLWRVTSGNGEPSYVYGTMHSTDPRVLELPQAAREAFDGAETYVIESTDVLSSTAMTMAMLKEPSLFMYTDGSSLDTELGPDLRDDLRSAVEERGLDWSQVARMKPWMVSGIVAVPPCEIARKNAGLPILDIALAEEAEREDKQVVGLETMGEQMQAMADLPAELHRRSLEGAIAIDDHTADVMETMVQLYLDDRIAEIMPTLEAAADRLDESGSEQWEGDDYAAFEKRIVTERNHLMADHALPLLAEGDVFVAVGALHLPGDEGVLALLEKAGYTVEPVELGGD